MVAKHGTSALPVQDEWEMLGRRYEMPFGDWLFQHHNEHRYPLGRLVWMGSLQISGFNFRVPMYLSVGLLTAAAVLLQWTARRLRGWTHPLDAVSAVLLLHWGHTFNLLMGYQVVFTLFAYAVAGWVWCGVNWSSTQRVGWAWGAAVYAVSLIFAGGFGVVVTPAVAGWLVYTGWTLARCRRWGSTIVFALLAVGVTGYSGWSWVTMPRTGVEHLHPIQQADRWLLATGDYLSGAFGFWGAEREGGWIRGMVTISVLAMYLVGVLSAGRWILHPESGRRAAGVVLLAVLMGTAGAALAVGLARPGMALGGRFATPSAVGLAVAVVAAGTGLRYRPRVAVTVAGGVVVLAVGTQVQTFPDANAMGEQMHSSLAGFRTDLLAGTPPVVLTGRHGGSFGVLVGAYLPDALPRFKQAGAGIFARMADDPPYIVVPVEGATLPAPVEPLPEGGLPLILPAPPPGAFAVRVSMAQGPYVGWQRVICIWTDPTIGRTDTSFAHPHWLGWPAALVLTFEGQPNGLTITGFRNDQRVLAVEWLVHPTP